MRAATIDKSLADTPPQDFSPICELSVERVPLTIRQQVSTLFGQLRADYEGIFVHLLRYAHVQDDTAIIRIPNQWKLHQQDGTWPCCYATLNTFVRLLCAVGILQRQPGGKHRPTQYHLSLSDHVIPPGTIAALDSLIDPACTKNCRVRRLAEKVKSRMTFLDGDQQKGAVGFEPVDPGFHTALHHVQQLLETLEKALHHVQQLLQAPGEGTTHKIQQLMTQISQARMEVHAANKLPDSRFAGSAADIPPTPLPLEGSQTDTQAKEKDAPKYVGARIVDSDSDNGAKSRPIKVDSGLALDSQPLSPSTSSTQVSEFATRESTAHLIPSVCQSRREEQNLLGNSNVIKKVGDSGLAADENLPASHQTVDFDPVIDNDRNTFSRHLLKGENTNVIDDKAAESTTERPRPLYRPIDARTACMLAKFVEGNSKNFRSYITLSQKYHPQIIRAAIINMLAHTYFPDVDGDLSADLDGELTGKIGRPRKPGAWVTSCCQAYAQHGLPPVMRLLLQAYDGSYNEVRERMEVLSTTLAPKRFWMQWQEQLLSDHLRKIPPAQEPLPPSDGTADRDSSTHVVLGGMSSSEVHELVNQINHEARSYAITARPCLQNGHWEAEIELRSRTRTSTYQFHSKREWEQYFAAIQKVALSTNVNRAI
jgi:hypothetical protein